jgi:ornithine--oxo-acid transaminase
VSLGHGHPRILKAMMEQASTLAVTSRAYHTELLGPFLDRLVHITGLDVALPMNTGAEAVETAIKAARRWGYRSKKIPQDRAEIIVAENNFHGRTTTIVGFSSDGSYREDFGPFAGGFKLVPFGDAQAVADAITENTCAVLIEPIQGEAGIIVPPEGYLKELRALCDRHNVLLILDEVQSGLGRTGRWFAHQHEDIRPDGLILGKALGGGVYPVSAMVGTRDLMRVFNPGSHGSTFGGNPLAARIGLEALAVIEEEHLVERSAEMGSYLLGRLRDMRSNIVKDVRGRGLWVGVEVDPNVASARSICDDLLADGILSKDTHGTVLRFAPPLTITRDEIDWGMERIERVFARSVH